MPQPVALSAATGQPETLKPRWSSTAWSQQDAAVGTSSVAAGDADGKHACRVAAVVAAAPCLWHAEEGAGGRAMALGAEVDGNSIASCIDLDWDKGLVAVGESSELAHHLLVYDPRHPGPASRAPSAHFAPLTRVRFSPLHPHWLASSSEDGLLKVWDLRRLDRCLFRLGWHLTAVSDFGWSWAHADMLVSSGRDGSQRFWNLSLPPYSQLAACDTAWGINQCHSY